MDTYFKKPESAGFWWFRRILDGVFGEFFGGVFGEFFGGVFGEFFCGVFGEFLKIV